MTRCRRAQESQKPLVKNQEHSSAKGAGFHVLTGRAQHYPAGEQKPCRHQLVGEEGRGFIQERETGLKHRCLELSVCRFQKPRAALGSETEMTLFPEKFQRDRTLPKPAFSWRPHQEAPPPCRRRKETGISSVPRQLEQCRA